MGDFCPPSLPKTDKLKTFTYHRRPDLVHDEPVVMGIDEAGRGPVLGPMVYAVAYAPVSYTSELSRHGYNDSKVLNAEVRLQLFRNLIESSKKDIIGWATTIMTAMDIGDGMLRPNYPYNLNDQAHDATINLIQTVLDSDVRVSELYVDTVGPPDKYQLKLSRRFPSIEQIVVTKKADSIYPVVSLASICAKVTRDLSLEDQLKENCGSGYPSDPATQKWLLENMDKLFGWGPLVRYSWGTAIKMMDIHGYKVVWKAEVEEIEKRKRQSIEQALMTPKPLLPKISMSYFGRPAV